MPRWSPTRAQPASSGTRQSSADHVAAGGGHRREQAGGAGAEVDRRHVDARARIRADVRRDVLLVVCRREHADPRVEELDDVGSRADLRRT